MDILLSTTHVIDGRPVSRYLGIVTGEAIVGANIFRDMFASVRDTSAADPPPTRGGAIDLARTRQAVRS